MKNSFGPRYGGVLRKAAVGAVVITFLLITLHWTLSYRARVAYEKSRPSSLGPIGSDCFITRGVALNMHEDEVEHIMSGGRVIMQHGHQQSPPWNGFVNIYEFTYGLDFALWKMDPYIQERYWVYFDVQGRAKKMKWSVIRRDGGLSEWKNMELERTARCTSQ